MGGLGVKASRCGEWGQSSQKYTGRGGVEKAGVRITGWIRGGLGWSGVERGGAGDSVFSSGAVTCVDTPTSGSGRVEL